MGKHSKSVNGQMSRLNASRAAVQQENLSAEKLRTETNFANYLCLLKAFSQRYCVFVVSCDTPWGLSFTEDLVQLMMNIGFKVDLFKKFRYAYAAIIDSGNLVFEKLENDLRLPVEKTLSLNGNNVKLHSSGFYASDVRSSVEINGEEFSPGKLGINFVIYDKISNIVLDSVCFDTCETISAYRLVEYQKMADLFLSNHPGVSLVCCKYMRFPNDYVRFSNDNLTQNEKFLSGSMFGLDYIAKNFDKKIFALNKYYNDSEVVEVLTPPTSYNDFNGVRRFEDRNGNLVNIAFGHRVTAYQTNFNESIRIFMIGGCGIFGVGASDNTTIESFLQKKFNEDAPQYNVIVENYGHFLLNLNNANEVVFGILNSLPVRPGDIVIWGNPIPQIPCIDLTKAAYEPRNYEVFFDRWHYTPDGNRLIAEKLFEALTSQGILEKAQQLADLHLEGEQTASNFDKDTNAQLAEYKSFLTNFYNSTLKQTIGAVVMNCNPFTLGHRYLIEKALEQCSFLILFLVEEDKSFFSFEDRLKLVDEGTKDISNLAIIPSGRFVLSSLTFSEYFNKSEMQDRIIDTSLDVTVFAREIAPCLHITKRFAGEEPFDNVTRQYNETMRRVLPEYGIEFVEIPRKAGEGGAISASRVRELLEKRDFDGLKPLVPNSTFKYLSEKFGG